MKKRADDLTSKRIKTAAEKGMFFLGKEAIFLGENVMEDQDEISIDLAELVSVLRQRLWLIILAAVLGAVLLGTYKQLTTVPMYSSSSMIYVYSKTTSITSLADLQIGKTLAVDFQILAKTRNVLESVISDMGLDMTYEMLNGMVEVTSPEDSHILQITVYDIDPVRSTDICNAVADEIRFRIAEVMNTDEPSSLERATVPENSYNTSIKKYVLAGGFLGGLAVAAVVILLYLLDDTIVNEDQVQKYLGMNTLAAIPMERGRRPENGEDERRSKRRKVHVKE